MEMPASASTRSRSVRQFFCWPLVFLAQLFGLRGLVLRLERLDLPLQRAHGIDGLVDLVEQPLLLAVGVLELADDAVDVHMLAADQPARLADFLGLRLGVLASRRRQLLFESGQLLLVLDDHVDTADGGAHARLQDLFGQLFFVEGDHFLDVADAAAQVFAQRDDLANYDRRARDGLHHAYLTALDALGDLDLTLAGEQRHRAHLAQVHAHRVVGLLEGSRRQVELDVVGLLARLRLVLVAIHARLTRQHVDALRVDGGHQIIELVGRGDVAGQQVVDLAVRQVSLLFAGIDELIYVVFVLI